MGVYRWTGDDVHRKGDRSIRGFPASSYESSLAAHIERNAAFGEADMDPSPMSRRYG
jgi:hypothetical protein